MRGQTNALPPDAVRTSGDQTINGNLTANKFAINNGDNSFDYYSTASENRTLIRTFGINNVEIRIELRAYASGNGALFLRKFQNGQYVSEVSLGTIT